MKLDDLDIKILKFLGLIKKPITTTDMAKQLFVIKNDYELKQKDNFVRMRLKKLSTTGLVYSKEKNRHLYYTLCEHCLVLSGTPSIRINGSVFKGEKGEYIFIVKDGKLEQILS
jgi:DNA-binding transcriptional regulator PaaX